MPFETPFGDGFKGTITATVLDENGVTPPARIIRADHNWAVQVDWETTGAGTEIITGTWHLHAYLESIGPNEADEDLIDFGDLNIPLTPGDSPVSYTAKIDVPASRIGPNVSHSGSIYKLVVSLTYLGPLASPGPMAAFVEGPTVQFYIP